MISFSDLNIYFALVFAFYLAKFGIVKALNLLKKF
jgi:hypothetical protein